MVGLGGKLSCCYPLLGPLTFEALLFLHMSPVLVEDYLEISYRADLDLLIARWLILIKLPRIPVASSAQSGELSA